MTFAIVVALLSAVLAVSVVVMLQALGANHENTRVLQQREVVELATRVGGVVTPRIVAEHLGVPPADADALLRTMVDDEHLAMAVDTQTGELRFEFLRLTQDLEMGSPGAYSRVRSTSLRR